MFELPASVVATCYVASVTATIVILVSLHLHMRNYRKPFQQRLMLRINLIVPLFAWSCYRMLLNQNSVFTKYFVEPLREVYEAFVIYTFYSLLTVMLGGERQIIVMTSGRPPVHHPVFPLSRILPPVDISDPQTFLYIKRGILQYVWLKPFLCFTILIGEVVGFYNVNDMSYKSVYLWLTVVYNITVSLSLYCLALFWKILWTDLKPFNPIGKFLCVKLIIFASYWQGVILAILNATGQLPEMGHHQSTAVAIQNALLCVELIPFAMGHWISFNWRDFSLAKLPSARVKWYYAMRDWLGIKDLIWDFKLTYHGDYYDYRQFDSVDALIAHPNSRGRTKKIQEGFRYHPDGQQKHWVDNNSVNEDPTRPILSTQERRAVGGYAASINSSLKAMYEVTPDDTPSGSNNNNNGSGDAFESEEPSLRGEGLDVDEALYAEAIATINNYNLDKPQVRRLLKYPVVDEMVSAHQYGYRVNQLRQQQQRGYGAV
ncbi:hypothetical protein DIURU_002509 [Diutina rugosa]|uniref:DUF300-domain-containing protein n=1 Tax=Diutina rugosa TaxID=5481 RepID=A0A642UQ05_DIURU|nr:uncharacterized protein DIURU_002509 [Diutina rugosa]KAA8903222.1 hypothetical protein DIURU_002509 [Diutina rugosa]